MTTLETLYAETRDLPQEYLDYLATLAKGINIGIKMIKPPPQPTFATFDDTPTDPDFLAAYTPPPTIQQEDWLKSALAEAV